MSPTTDRVVSPEEDLPTGGVTEVDPDEALAEARAGIDQAADADQGDRQQEEIADVIDTIQPKAEPKVWVLKSGSAEDNNLIEREYVQRPLSFFGKMQFFSLVGEMIDKAVSGEDGLRISSLFNAPTLGGGSLSADDFRDAETFMQAVGKLLTYMPDFLQKCYCIWWNIPEHERPWAIAVMSQTPEEGGLTDDEGLESVAIFIDQNWEALDDFFRDKIGSLRNRVEARRKAVTESRRSKPSNGTQPPTPSV